MRNYNMLDEVLDRVTGKIIEHLSQEKNQQRLIQTMEQFITERFTWIIRCFEMISLLAIVQTIMLGYIIYRLHANQV